MVGKRLIILVLALAMAMFVIGCGGKEAIDETGMEMDSTPPPVEVDETPIEKPPVVEKDMSAPMLNDVFFDFDKSNLSAAAKSKLEGDASELKRRDDVAIVIEGHCDERGTKSYNLALGEKRAQAAKDYLVALGISSSRITIISYGKERPFDTGRTEAAWAKNRRAHIVTK